MLREEFKEGDGAAAPAPTRWVVELNGTLAPLAALRLETRPRLVALVVKPQDRAVLDDDHVHTDELCDQFSAAIATLAVARFDRRPLAR